jgi:hypothetical protein
MGQRVVDAVGAVAHFRFKVRAAWRGPSLPRLSLPGGSQATLRIGRMPECDLQLFDTTVSRYHAEFRRSPAGWFLVDLGSTGSTAGASTPRPPSTPATRSRSAPWCSP